MEIKKQQSLKGVLSVPGDKSISHRAVMFGALARGTTRVSHFLEGADCLSTISCFRKMGIDIEKDGEELLIHGRGLRGLNSPREILNAGNSGTTTRLISGILAGQKFISELDGDASLRSRPMKRIMDPLTAMGADIRSLMDNGCMPLRIAGRPLHAVHYNSPVASAQVKSCVLLAGMYADGVTSVTEPFLSRNHTEIMLNYFGAKVTSQGTTASILPEPELSAREVCVRRYLLCGLLYRRRPSHPQQRDPFEECRDQSHKSRYFKNLPPDGSGYYASERKTSGRTDG